MRVRVALVVRDVLLMTLLVVLNPYLLAIILLIVSRPRPVQNLCAYWVGCMITNLPIFLVPLVALHLIPSFASFAHDFATPVPGATLKPIQLGGGIDHAPWSLTSLPCVIGNGSDRRSWSRSPLVVTLRSWSWIARKRPRQTPGRRA